MGKFGGERKGSTSFYVKIMDSSQCLGYVVVLAVDLAIEMHTNNWSVPESS